MLTAPVTLASFGMEIESKEPIQSRSPSMVTSEGNDRFRRVEFPSMRKVPLMDRSFGKSRAFRFVQLAILKPAPIVMSSGAEM